MTMLVEEKQKRPHNGVTINSFDEIGVVLKSQLLWAGRVQYIPSRGLFAMQSLR